MENGRINGARVSDENEGGEQKWRRGGKKNDWERTRRGTSRKVKMKRKGAEGGCVDRKLIFTLFVLPCSNWVKAEG